MMLGFCSSCGNEVASDISFCPKCGKQVAAQNASSPGKTRSRWWYLLPIFFEVIGGVIAYFVLKEDDKKLAKNCLLLGIILTVIGFVIGLVFASIFAITQSEFSDHMG